MYRVRPTALYPQRACPAYPFGEISARKAGEAAGNGCEASRATRWAWSD